MYKVNDCGVFELQRPIYIQQVYELIGSKKPGGRNMDVIVLERESYEAVLSVPSPAEYSRIKQEDAPLPFTFAAVKTEVEVSRS
jgi:hypothetical protein